MELPDVGVDNTTDSVVTSDPPTNDVTDNPVYLNDSELIKTTILNQTNDENDIEYQYVLFEKFVIIEMVMTTLELIISILAVTWIPRWRNNYRNQMLMQLTLARFMKRIIIVFKFLQQYQKISSSECVTYMLLGFQFYIDFVIVILVFFFIKHMYNSLIIVLVKISQNNFYRVLLCSWLIPLPITAICTAVIVCKAMETWLVYLLICSIFRWPLIFVGTGLYITIVYRVLAEKIRHFASSLAVVTFLLCLILNVYLFSKDVIVLWCEASFSTELIGYVSGFLMNLLILGLYAVLIILNSNNKTQTSKSVLPDFSLAEAKF